MARLEIRGSWADRARTASATNVLMLLLSLSEKRSPSSCERVIILPASRTAIFSATILLCSSRRVRACHKMTAREMSTTARTPTTSKTFRNVAPSSGKTRVKDSMALVARSPLVCLGSYQNYATVRL